MSVSQIPNLPVATTLGGGEQLEAVQSGTSVQLTVSQIGAYVSARYPVSTITSVTATSPLQAVTVSNAVTISLPLNSVTNAYLAAMPNNTIMGNFTGCSSQPAGRNRLTGPSGWRGRGRRARGTSAARADAGSRPRAAG